MVKLPFDPKTGRLDWSKAFADPVDCARHLWKLPAGDEWFLQDLLECAPNDPEAYDALTTFARNHPNATDELKLRIYEIIVQPKPRKRQNQYRDNRLRMIARVLCADYGLNLSRNEASHHVQSAASILADVVPLDETVLAKIIRKQK